jgi:hypothetical protein
MHNTEFIEYGYSDTYIHVSDINTPLMLDIKYSNKYQIFS